MLLIKRAAPFELMPRAPLDEENVTEEFLITAVVGGPEEVSFRAARPAKLRFFVGYVDEIGSEHDLVRVTPFFFRQRELTRRVRACSAA